jgi:hypothetical protein
MRMPEENLSSSGCARSSAYSKLQSPLRLPAEKQCLRPQSPSLQKYQHAKTAAFCGIHLGEVKHNGSGVSLQGNSFAQLEGRVAVHNSALALNDCYFANVVDILL